MKFLLISKIYGSKFGTNYILITIYLIYFKVRLINYIINKIQKLDMESTPQNQKSTILIEGYLKFENEGMISSFSEYWMQVIETGDAVSEG